MITWLSMTTWMPEPLDRRRRSWRGSAAGGGTDLADEGFAEGCGRVGALTGEGRRRRPSRRGARDEDLPGQAGRGRCCGHGSKSPNQVVIDADTRLVVAVGKPVPGNRNDCKTWKLSGAAAAVGRTTVIADGGYRGTGLVIPHRREPGQGDPRPGKRTTAPPTARSARVSNTPSPA